MRSAVIIGDMMPKNPSRHSQIHPLRRNRLQQFARQRGLEGLVYSLQQFARQRGLEGVVFSLHKMKQFYCDMTQNASLNFAF